MPGLADRGCSARAAAGDGYDAFDEPHPPRMPRRYLDVFRATPTGTRARWSASAAAPVSGAVRLSARRQDRVIGFVVESDQAGPVTLSWSLATDLELAQHFVVLRDLETGQTRDLWRRRATLGPAARPARSSRSS